MNSEKIARGPSIADQVSLHLRRAIVAGTYSALEPINEAGVARELGISRGPVREALIRLSADGLVELLPGRGARVPEVTYLAVASCFDVRIALDCTAARLAAAAEAGDILEMKAAQARAGSILDTDANEQYPVGIDVHQMIAKASHSPYLEEKVREVSAKLAPVRARARMSAARSHQAHMEHVAILHAIESRNGGLASELMEAHDEVAKLFYLSTFVFSSTDSGSSGRD